MFPLNLQIMSTYYNEIFIMVQKDRVHQRVANVHSRATFIKQRNVGYCIIHRYFKVWVETLGIPAAIVPAISYPKNNELKGRARERQILCTAI